MTPLLLSAALLAVAALPRTAGPSACAAELNRIHTVNTRDGFYLLYGDPSLAAYLQQLAPGSCPAAVLPILSDEAASFRHGNSIVVTTGLVLASRSEADLRAALPAIATSPLLCRRIPMQSICTAAQSTATFEEHRARLARDIAAYRELTSSRLKLRAAVNSR